MEEQRLQRRSGEAIIAPRVQGEQMVAALNAYKSLQRQLDAAMPDQLMAAGERTFRKKGYWRAIAVAFDLDVTLVSEERRELGKFLDGRDNFGWFVVYKAEASNGRAENGDGACTAVEKAPRFRCPHPQSEGSDRSLHWPHNTCPDYNADHVWRTLPSEATDHNVRAHAHTRAFNRAVSNLCGFGEVSAEEVDPETGEEVRSAGRGRTAGASTTRRQGAPPPAGTSASASATPPAADGSVTIRKRAVLKTGENARGAWTLAKFEFSDGRSATTLDPVIDKTASALVASGAPCWPLIEPGKKGPELVGFSEAPKAKEPPPPPDEPVTGPERILTIRSIDTEAGERFVIQTSKRQLATENKSLADACRDARTKGLGIVPTFEEIPRGDGHKVNRLTAITVGEVAAPAEAAAS